MERDLKEKMRIINKMINGNTDEKSQKVEFVEERYYHCNTIEGIRSYWKTHLSLIIKFKIMNQNIISLVFMFCFSLNMFHPKIRYYIWVELSFRKWRENREFCNISKRWKV